MRGLENCERVDSNNDYEQSGEQTVLRSINIQDSSCKLEEDSENVSSFLAQSEVPRVLKDIGACAE